MNIDINDEYKMLYCTATVPWEKLRHKTIFVAGATGLIGSSLVRTISIMNNSYDLNCHIIAYVRDVEKARKMFEKSVLIVSGSLEKEIHIDENLDFIVNAACPTQSSFMISNPVDVIRTSIIGTINLLNLAKEKKASFLYLSSMEVYGENTEEKVLSEEMLGYLNPLVLRSCYPESKRLCESLVVSYSSQFEIDAKSIRLAQTFGPGIEYFDKRVFAMMARCAIENREIVLHTKGLSKHQFLYVFDAVSAILFVLLLGVSGNSYNAGNPNTYCSIYDMGKMVSEQFGGDKCILQIEESDTSMFPKTSIINLDIGLISSLGWKPLIGLEEMFSYLIKYMKNNKY